MVKKTEDENGKGFEKFLRDHRPEAPLASRAEQGEIWERLKDESRLPRLWDARTISLFASCLVLGLVVLLQMFAPKDSGSQDEVLLVQESMNLNFIDGEEINEVVDLVSIGR